MWSLLVGPVSGLLDTVLKRVLPPEKMSEVDRAKLEQELLLELSKQDWGLVQGQLQANIEEAKHESRFVAGWRPFVGWVCGAAFGFHFLLKPIVLFTTAYLKYDIPPLPEFDMSSLMTVLLGLLGLGGLRTFEKYSGTNKSR